jgi:peptidyl-prolyl cis-trans isomerase SurA
MIRTAFLAATLAFLSTLVMAQTVTPTPAKTKPAIIDADRIVAVVNNGVITLHDLRTRMALIERQLRAEKVQLPTEDVLEKQLLERMILDLAQMQFAQENGIEVSGSDVDAALSRIAESNHMTIPQFRQALEKDNIDWAKFHEDIGQEITLARLRNREVDERLTVSEDEIDRYLEEQAKNGGNDAIVQVAHIIVRIPEQASVDDQERAQAKAEQALRQLKSGAEFRRVAAIFSDAPDGLAGGVMDPRPLDRLPGLYADAVRNLSPGETSDILRSPIGFHVVRLLSRQSGAAPAPVKQTHARHILIKVNDLLSDSEARQRALALKERLDNGADFAVLARQNSADLSAAKGGDLGWLYQGDTVPDFERAMDALDIGGVSAPVHTPFGWHIIQVLERRTDDVSQERRRQSARQILRERKADDAYQDWLRQLRDRTYVEYHLDDK